MNNTMPKTKLLFLDDPSPYDCKAIVLGISSYLSGDDSKPPMIDIVLDQTCFYPRGGGQDWDKGTITNGSSVAEIDEVRIDVDGVVHHFSTCVYDIKVGDEVDCAVDKDRRIINSRLHSAGHLIDMAVTKLGLDWKPTKGQHYPDLSAVEYEGAFESGEEEALSDNIEQLANSLQNGLSSHSKIVSVEGLSLACHAVSNNLPKNKPCRLVFFGADYAVPCGGTHVINLREVGHVTISKLKQKKGTIRISYKLDL